MTKKQRAFYDCLQKLKAEETGTRLVEAALMRFFKNWEMYEKDGIKDSMTVAMEATEAFTGYSVKVHLN